MSADHPTCDSPIAWAVLVDYWAGDLSPDDTDVVEGHLMGCGGCSVASARVGAIARSARALVVPIASRRELERLRARGMRVVENVFSPGERREVVFQSGTDLLVHRLRSPDLGNAESVRVTVSIESTGQIILDLPDAPFERDPGEVLILCQRHFADIPHDIALTLRAREPSGVEHVAVYLIPHVFE